MKAFKINQIEEKRILGRIPALVEDALPLFWGASALEVNVKSNEFWILVSADYDNFEPWIAVEINGYQTERFMVTKGEPRWYCVARNLNPEKENLISIIKDTQPMPGDEKHSLFIHQLGISEDGSFCKLKPRKLNIEFIGDSITSGEGLAGNPDEMEWITQWFCASKTYAVQVAKKLDADFSVLSQCGWGICWGWDGNINSALPPHYNEVCSVMGGNYQKKLGADEKYNFKSKTDYVILNLGTNDNGAFHQNPWKDDNGIEHVLDIKKDGSVITAGVKVFLKNIREKNPDAKIIWTWGMIKLDFVPEYVMRGIEEYKKESGDGKVFTLELDCMEENELLPEDKGSRGHPGPKTHRLAAEKITAFIKN